MKEKKFKNQKKKFMKILKKIQLIMEKKELKLYQLIIYQKRILNNNEIKNITFTISKRERSEQNY